MIVKVLASGSKGNSTLITTKNAKILIDVGLTTKELQKRLEDTNLTDIDAIIITHAHIDHIKGLAVIEKKYDIKVYTKENLDNPQTIKDIEISHFNVSHDVPCIGLLIKNNNQELVYITDTGYINRKIISLTKNKDIYIIESNHDEDMLIEGSYPFILKKRISGDEGHLSNRQTTEYLKTVMGDKTKYIVLAHLSEENNTKDKAYDETNSILRKTNIKLYVSMQDQALNEIKV